MPGLSGHLAAALEVPGEHIIDPWSAPLGYLTQAVALGAQLVRNAEVLSGAFDGTWHIETAAGPILAASVVNAAGLFGDIVDARLGLALEFRIKPRKGQFVVLDKAARRHVPRIVLPVPTEITKGIVVCPTAFGNVLVGPTAEEQDDRERATVETATLEALLKRGAEIVPALAAVSVTAVYAGLRPASERSTTGFPRVRTGGRSRSAASAPPVSALRLVWRNMRWRFTRVSPVLLSRLHQCQK